ncbi:MAG: hypothetical protein HRT72_06445 [Flavobacteriales bacterium]|nr:hypothetical protein [Flavobacteriales bacterium]
MKTYDLTTFTKKIGIKADMKDLYDAWTRADKIETWFLSQATNYRGSEAIPNDENVRTAGQYEWSWYLHDMTDRAEFTQVNGLDLLNSYLPVNV